MARYEAFPSGNTGLRLAAVQAHSSGSNDNGGDVHRDEACHFVAISFSGEADKLQVTSCSIPVAK